MRIYARPGALLLKQVCSDIGFFVLVVLLVFVGRAIRDALAVFAVPARALGGTVSGLSAGLASAADNVGGVVGIGGTLRVPFDSLAAGFGEINDYALQTADMVDRAAFVVAIVVCAVPLVLYVWKWVPFRVRFAHRAWSARGLLPAEHAPELFALRALAGLPLAELAKVSHDPMGAWLRGDRRVIRTLADMELRRDGLRLPKARS